MDSGDRFHAFLAQKPLKSGVILKNVLVKLNKLKTVEREHINQNATKRNLFQIGRLVITQFDMYPVQHVRIKGHRHSSNILKIGWNNTKKHCNLFRK